MIAITAPFWTLELLHKKLDVIFAPKTAPKHAPKLLGELDIYCLKSVG